MLFQESSPDHLQRIPHRNSLAYDIAAMLIACMACTHLVGDVVTVFISAIIIKHGELNQLKSLRCPCVFLYIMRHGKAEERKPGQSDEERRLTDEGRQDVELVARLMPYKPSVVFTSPIRRAVETGEVVSRVWSVELRVVEELHPQLLSLDSLKRVPLTDNAVLVGHAPSIERLLSNLIGGGNIKLKAGAIAGIELERIEEGKAVLQFVITPEIARKCVLRT